MINIVTIIPRRDMRHVHENAYRYGQVGGWQAALPVRPDICERVMSQLSVRPGLLSPGQGRGHAVWRDIAAAATATTGRTVVHTAWGHGLSCVILALFMKWEPGFREFNSFIGELHQAFLQVGEWSLHQAMVLLVMMQQMVPQHVSAQHLGVRHHYHGVLGSGQGYI
jgi:hypothetical protein